MAHYIDKDAFVAEIKNFIKRAEAERVLYPKTILAAQNYLLIEDYKKLLSTIDTLETKECEAKSGIVQKDLQIILDDGMYIDLDPSMQLKPSFSVKEGEKVKVVISKED